MKAAPLLAIVPAVLSVVAVAQDPHAGHKPPPTTAPAQTQPSPDTSKDAHAGHEQPSPANTSPSEPDPHAGHRALPPAPDTSGRTSLRNIFFLMPHSAAKRSGALLAELARETRLAIRSLANVPGFSLVTIVSLGFGLALATTTHAITNAYLLRSLPYPEGHRLYHVRYAPPDPTNRGA